MSAEHQYHFVLTANRNKLLRVNLFIQVTMIFCAFAVLIPTIFGMNLWDGLEDQSGKLSPIAWITVVCMVVGILVSYRVLSVYAR